MGDSICVCLCVCVCVCVCIFNVCRCPVHVFRECFSHKNVEACILESIISSCMTMSM